MTVHSAGPVYFLGVSATTSSRGSGDPELGTRVRSGDEDYIFVYNAGNSVIPQGHGAIVSAVTGYSVTVSSTSGADILVGVCRNASISTGYYGWLCTRGFTPIEMGANYSAAAGSRLCLGGDGVFDIASNTTGNVDTIWGKAMEAIASGASGQAFIQC